MDPTSDEAGKETNGQEDDNKDQDEGPVVNENEFQKCSRKGRRDACPDIHCKCGDSKHSDQCLFHKENLETELEEKSSDEKTWKISPLRTLLSTRPACFDAFLIWPVLFICGPSGTELIFERVLYFLEKKQPCKAAIFTYTRGKSWSKRREVSLFIRMTKALFRLLDLFLKFRTRWSFLFLFVCFYVNLKAGDENLKISWQNLDNVHGFWKSNVLVSLIDLKSQQL